MGIPVVVDRVIQQAVAQVFSELYDECFSEHSYGFRPNRSAHQAMEEVLFYLNEGCEWVIDIEDVYKRQYQWTYLSRWWYL